MLVLLVVWQKKEGEAREGNKLKYKSAAVAGCTEEGRGGEEGEERRRRQGRSRSGHPSQAGRFSLDSSSLLPN